MKIIDIKTTLNWGLPAKLKESFPNLESTNHRLKVEFTNIKNLNWIRGFTEAEGSFQVVIQKINNRVHLSLIFSITQNIRDEELLNQIVTYLDCGRYYRGQTRNEGQYLVTVFSDITEKILPIFHEYPLIGIKKADYLDFVQIAELIKSKDHLTKEGIEKIQLIKNNMNKSRILLK